MVKLLFVARWEFKKMLTLGTMPKNTPLISISDTKHEVKEIHQYFAFHGIDPELTFTANFPDNSVGISRYDAERLVRFIKTHGDTNYVIHCYMGISRSAAVAKFINDYYNMSDSVLNTYLIYNKQVYNALNAVVGKDLASHYAEMEKADRGSWSE